MNLKKSFFIFLLSILAISIFSAPSTQISSGYIHSLDAILKEQRLNLGFHFYGSSRDFQIPYISTIDGDTHYSFDTYAFATLMYGLGYSFTNWLEVNIYSNINVDAIDTPESSGRVDANTNYASYGFGDTEIGLKLTTGGIFGATKNADFGIYGFYRLATGDIFDTLKDNTSSFSIDYVKNHGGIFRHFTTNGQDFGVKLLISFVTSTQVPLAINLNGGYTKFNNLPSSISNPVMFDYSGSFSIRFGSFIPFFEVYGTKYMFDQVNDGRLIHNVTGGVRFDTPIGLVIDLAADYRISKFVPDLEPTLNTSSDILFINDGWEGTPDWKVFFGLTYYYDFKQEVVKKEEPKTLITGKIIDGESGKPLSAIITLPGYSETLQIVTDSTGLYSIEVKPGSIRLKVEREGYRWQEKGIIIEKGQTKIVDFALNKKVVAQGIITGWVKDKSTGENIQAKLSFPQTDIPTFTPDPQTGVYRISLNPGTYTLAATLDGYVTYVQPVVIEADKTLILNIEMLKKGGKITLRGINFESGKATILPESYPILDEAVKLLKDNPKVRIEVQGHTDSVGSERSNLLLSQARAEAVRNYLILKGIDPSRIVAKGFGELMPIADNATREGRAKNRRIEFLILGE
ncbi:MAG: OmpA family protein [bacterium]|uniref:Ompa/motb domain protein n=2 Tax=Bacteria candidate phyla TaxID=1783234 RepID=A0A117M711_UNCT6|nr:MAG: ompa/motb domain protein [candidate division TA06 bacterium 32_111]KUK87832.1 MAG: ompa/motb domain protein [candidate division TA06 bacterium 34_109]MDI6700637.1 OmpA family protein [bacterium]HAF07985.1 hypothetical protein [candidate division WOR-3 bacterium]HCP16313.1 hypothetical protein [candidate division WOR-3 bacterium]